MNAVWEAEYDWSKAGSISPDALSSAAVTNNPQTPVTETNKFICISFYM